MLIARIMELIILICFKRIFVVLLGLRFIFFDKVK